MYLLLILDLPTRMERANALKAGHGPTTAGDDPLIAATKVRTGIERDGI